jgi:nucleoside-diphosphate-sugar epimerase
MNAKKVIVCGGGGFIGGHLIADLRRQGAKEIRSVNIKPPGLKTTRLNR